MVSNPGMRISDYDVAGIFSIFSTTNTIAAKRPMALPEWR